MQSGDLVFQDLDCGAVCEAIEKVTPHYKGSGVSHVGVVYKKVGDDWFILEAYPPKVKLIKLSEFLKRSIDEKGRPKVFIGRLKEKYIAVMQEALTLTPQYLNAPYDAVFLENNKKYYCAELIYEMLLKANGNQPVFTLGAMTFKDPETKQLMPVWKKYYQKLGVPVPEGKPGINPGKMLVSDKIKVLFRDFR